MNYSSWLSEAAIVVASASSFVALLKEKKERRGKRWHRNALSGFTAIALVVGTILIWQTSRESTDSEERHQKERQTDKQQIAGLTQSVQTQIDNNDKQYLRNLQEVHRLQDQLTDLKKSVATEEVRKKMEALQAQLDKVLKPAPQAKLQGSFWVSAIQEDVVTEIYAPVDNNIVRFSLDVVNYSDVDAKSGEVWIRICGACKFNKEPPGFEHPAGAPDFELYSRFVGLGSNVRSEKFEIEVQLPPNASGKMVVLMKSRCDNCEIERDWQRLSVTLGIIPFRKRIASP